MKKFILGLVLFILGFIFSFILLIITIYREVEPYVVFSQYMFILLSLIGLAISLKECYFTTTTKK